MIEAIFNWILSNPQVPYPPAGTEVLLSFWNLLIPLAISGISAAAGALGNRKSTQTQEQYQTGNTQQQSFQDVDLSTMPEYAPEVWGAILQNLGNLQGQASGQGIQEFIQSYLSGGMRNINQAADLRRKGIENILAQRGLNLSPSGANSLAGLESARVSDIVNFANQMPMYQRQLQNENSDRLSQFLTALPTGQRQFGNTRLISNQQYENRGNMSQTNPGNVLGGLFSGLGAGLASTYGTRWLKGTYDPQPQPSFVSNTTPPGYNPGGRR